jgi:hypothetical protein
MFPIDPNQSEPRKRHGDPLGSEARSRAIANVSPRARRPEHGSPRWKRNVSAGAQPTVASDEDGKRRAGGVPTARTAPRGEPSEALRSG